MKAYVYFRSEVRADVERAIHFIIAWAFAAFVAIHLFEVLISGAFNQLRGMLTGYYKIDDEPAAAPVTPPEETAHD